MKHIFHISVFYCKIDFTILFYFIFVNRYGKIGKKTIRGYNKLGKMYQLGAYALSRKPIKETAFRAAKFQLRLDWPLKYSEIASFCAVFIKVIQFFSFPIKMCIDCFGEQNMCYLGLTAIFQSGQFKFDILPCHLSHIVSPPPGGYPGKILKSVKT